MSHYPPGGPPPPPYGYPAHPPHPQHAPHPPTAPGYAYVPTPVMMPMPMYPAAPAQPPVDPAYSQPTYVTNVYYQNQPEPVQVVDNNREPPIDWVPATGATANSFAHRAVVGGKEGWDSSPLWIIRAHHGGDLVPGKLAVQHRSAYIAYNGKEVPVHNFEILCAPSHMVRWVPSSNGQVPVGAIAAGNTHNAEPLYVGRATHMRSVTPGKIHPSHGCMYMPFGGAEIPFKHYEVLCQVV